MIRVKEKVYFSIESLGQYVEAGAGFSEPGNIHNLFIITVISKRILSRKPPLLP